MKNKDFKPKSNNKKFKNKKQNISKKKASTQDTEEDFDFDSIEDIEKAYDEFEDDDFEDLLEDEEDEEDVESNHVNDGTVNDDDDEMEEDEESENIYRDEQQTDQSLKKLEKELAYNVTAVAALKKIYNALAAAVDNIKESDDEKQKSNFKVKDPQIFNQIVRLCLTKIPSTLHRLFELKTLSDRPTKNKKWIMLSSSLKRYLKNMILLIKSISEPTMIEKILKNGILPLLPFYAEFSDISWHLAKQINIFWSTSEEKVRVLSVIVFFRLMGSYNEESKEKILKMLYVSFVQNCRFTSPSTWPMIDFMRMSLAELYCMDQTLAYRHAFIYIRQLASHLRNAMLIQKKERTQLVYNWQFVHCLHFWSELLGKTHPSEILKPLIYPVVQISHGILTLMKSPLYYPLTFHVCNLLAELSDKTDIFIPVLPYLMEILTSQRLRKTSSNKSSAPFDWNCIIKVSKIQLDESAFSDGLIDQVFNSSLKYLSTQCNSIGFPELVFPYTLQLKTFLKKCKIPNYTRKIKQLLDKVNENSQFIESQRKNVSFKISDSEAIRNWEIQVGQSVPPLKAFSNQWDEMNKSILKRQREEEEEYAEGDDGRQPPKKKLKNSKRSNENGRDFSKKKLKNPKLSKQNGGTPSKKNLKNRKSMKRNVGTKKSK